MTPPTVALGAALADIRSGFASGDNLAEGVFQIRMNNVSRRGELLLDKRRRVSPHSKQIAKSLLQPGDVLFNATNSPDLVGKTAIFLGCDEPAVFSNHFIRLRTREHRLDSRYLTRWLQREFEHGYFKAKCKQWVNQATFGQDRLVERQIPLPPIGEQRRIAAVLDAAEALRAKRRQSLTKLDMFLQAVFTKVFGDLTSTERVRFETLLVKPLRNGISPSRSGRFTGTVLTLSAITGQSFDSHAVKESTFTRPYIEEQTVSVESFLVCRGNGNLALVGRGKYPEQSLTGVAFPDTMIAARCDPEKISSDFLSRIWDSPIVRRQIESAARTTNGTHKINQTTIKEVEIPIPGIKLQRQFEHCQKVIALQRDRLNHSALQFDSLFASLQQRAFRGEL